MRAALVLVLLLAAPPAAARDAGPVEGDLRFPDGATLRGQVDALAARGLLDLGPVATSNATLLGWEAATGYLVEKAGTYRTLAGEATADPRLTPENETLDLGPGALRGLSCRSGCVVVLFTEEEPGSTLGFAGPFDGPLAWLRAPVGFGAGLPGGARNSFHLEAAPGWAALPADAPALGTRVGLFLWNVSGELVTDEGARPFRTGVERRPLPGPLGAAGEEMVTRHLVLHLDAPRLHARGPGATLWADAPLLGVDGALDAPRAEGALRADGRVHAIEGRSLHLEGAFDLRPRGETGTLPAADVRDPFAGGGLAGSLRGEATRVAVGGVALAQPGLPQEAAAGALALVALLAVLWLLKPLLLSPFYTRIDPSRVLANPNRARLHGLVAETPGLTASDLVRLTGKVRVVVDHHLRTLVAHGYLVARGQRYRVRYFPCERAPDERTHARMDALHDPTRRKVALALLEAPGASQKEIAARAGIRQRLVSHHLRRLVEEGLAAAEGSMPRRYKPGPELEAALRA